MRELQKEMPCENWPEIDRQQWEAAFKKGAFLEDHGAKSHLSAASICTAGAGADTKSPITIMAVLQSGAPRT